MPPIVPRDDGRGRGLTPVDNPSSLRFRSKIASAARSSRAAEEKHKASLLCP